MSTREIRFALLAMGIGISLPVDCAQTGTTTPDRYPVKPIRLVIPFAPGGPVDIVARIVALKLGDALGSPLIADNRAGASGNIAVEIVAHSTPDGYTLLIGSNGTNAINPSLFPKFPVNPVRDLAPIGTIASSPLVLVAHPSVTAGSVAELINLAKSKPLGINFASAGSGSTAHLAAELFNRMAGVQCLHVPYKGAGPALADLVGGQVQIMFTGISGTLQHIRAGKLKALGVSSEHSQPVLPSIPPISESLPGYEVTTWYGLFTPAKTPVNLIDVINRALAKMIAAPDVLQRFAALGADPAASSPAQFATVIRKDVAKWAKVIKESGVHPD
jgi:tripartite-type tricarboxylate transporter receptor subunit TctC